MKLKTALVFADWYSPAFKAGGPVKSVLNTVKLLKNDYRFYVICGDRDLGDTKPFHSVQTDQWIVGEAGENIWYISAQKMNSSFIKKILAQIQPDFVYLNSVFSRHFAILPLSVLRHSGIPVFLSPRGMFHPAALNVKKWKKRIFFKWMSLTDGFKHIHLIATDETEKQHILTTGLLFKAISVAANPPDMQFLNKKHECLKQANSLKIITVSRISPEKNCLFLLELLEKLEFPATFTWIGDSIQANYKDKFMGLWNHLPAHITRILKGSLTPEEIANELSEHHVFLLPSLGENFGHSIFEALASGLPCVISDKTPWRNLAGQKAGYDLPLHDKTAFISHLKEYFHMNSEDYRNYSRSAKACALRYVENNHLSDNFIRIFGK